MSQKNNDHIVEDLPPPPPVDKSNLNLPAYKDDFLFVGLNKFFNLVQNRNLSDDDWSITIKDDPAEMFNKTKQAEHTDVLEIKNLLFNHYRISSTKYNFNAMSHNFYLREKHFPGQRVPPVNSLQELASMATYEELTIMFLTSPSFIILTQGKELLKKIHSGVFKSISPKIKTFYFPLIALKSIPDVILWHYSETDLKSILDVTGGKVEDILDNEGFVKTKHWPTLIDNYVSETNEPLENIRSWEH